jgi:hypothetical protein
MRARTRSLQARFALLREAHAPAHDWRRLHFDSMRAYLDGQRRFIALHTELLSIFTADRELHHLLRQEALELFLALSELHVFVLQLGAELAGNV